MIWVRPENIFDSLHPERYSSEHETLSSWLSNHSDGKFIHIYSAFAVYKRSFKHGTKSSNIYWHIRQDKDKFIIEMMHVDPKEGRYLLLPDEAIIIGRLSDNVCPTLYWSSELIAGSAYVDSDSIILVPVQKNTYQWVAIELRNEVAQQQLKLASVGPSIDRLSINSVMNIKVPAPNEEECNEKNEVVRNELLNLVKIAESAEQLDAAKKTVKQVLLTGATFEERITQFEEYLIQQRFFNEKKSFFAENVGDDNNIVNYMIRPLRASWSIGQQTFDGNHDKTIVNSVQNSSQDLNDVIVQYDARSDNDWLSWINDVNGSDYKLFNVGNDTYGIPDNITTSILRQFYGSRIATDNEFCTFKVFPAYTSFIDLLQIDDEDTFDDIVTGDNISAYTAALITNKTARQTLYDLYSPALAIKVIRDNKLVGVYIFISDYEPDRQQEIEPILNGYGTELSKLVSQISEFVSDAARRESLRRLSSVMHRLNGPTGRATNAIQDIQTFLENNPEICDRLIPDDATAKGRARMLDEPLEMHSLRSRLNDIYCAVEDIRKVSYQVRRLKLVQGDLEKIPCDAVSIIEQGLLSINRIIPELRTEIIASNKYIVNINSDVITAAIEEVLSNSCREMKEHSVKQPELKIYISKIDNYIQFRIIDNGLPTESALISNPFDEDASKYARSGRGSGLGLTIVRETFLRHGGNCDLYENKSKDGVRFDGVTFEATLPEYISP